VRSSRASFDIFSRRASSITGIPPAARPLSGLSRPAFFGEGGLTESLFGDFALSQPGGRSTPSASSHVNFFLPVMGDAMLAIALRTFPGDHGLLVMVANDTWGGETAGCGVEGEDSPHVLVCAGAVWGLEWSTNMAHSIPFLFVNGGDSETHSRRNEIRKLIQVVCAIRPRASARGEEGAGWALARAQMGHVKYSAAFHFLAALLASCFGSKNKGGVRLLGWMRATGMRPRARHIALIRECEG
jgi:hypothetical protein